MTDDELQKISREIISDLTGKKKIKLEASFYTTRSLNHKIRLDRGKIYLQIAEALRTAPEKIIRTLIIILVLKLYKFKVDRQLYRIYRNFLEENPHLIPANKIRKPSTKYTPYGRFFDLEALFDQLNRQYFNDRLIKPKLGWSLRKSYRRLGFFSAEKNLLVISRVFDSPNVPTQVVQYLLYHEMLHMAHPVVNVNGRRRIHSSEFRQQEKNFPDYDQIQKWIKKNLRKL